MAVVSPVGRESGAHPAFGLGQPVSPRLQPPHPDPLPSRGEGKIKIWQAVYRFKKVCSFERGHRKNGSEASPLQKDIFGHKCTSMIWAARRAAGLSWRQ